MVLMFVTLIISLTVHEAAHALVAMLGGDRTAYVSGQVTLNPLPHMQRAPIGMVVLPIACLLLSQGTSIFGFAHAPVDARWVERYPKRAAVMSLAGPLANVLLAAIAFAVLWFIARPDTDTERTIRQIATVFLMLNVLLAVFNLLPLPPLDGAGVVGGLYPPARHVYEAILRIPYFDIVLLVVLFQIGPHVFWPIFHAVDRLLPFPTIYG